MDFQDFQTGTDNTAIYAEAIKKLLEPIKTCLEETELSQEELDFNNFLAMGSLNHIEMLLLICYPLLGYVGEVAELANKFKKVIRGDKEFQAFLEDSLAEQGDALYYAAQFAKQTGYSLEDVAKTNNRKLADRLKRGVIGGDGDNR